LVQAINRSLQVLVRIGRRRHLDQAEMKFVRHSILASN
jgi:hypothetical protein